ncbi:hypothetical protein ABZV34_30225 [Streptomyces sp. NPDC005195]|uniref:hypothetical protein n=1 Tax=Streptomyces sp. NPDC005195 TaxID=3154561 RepID=UPI0033A25463
MDVDDLQQQLGQPGHRYGGEGPQCLLKLGQRARGTGGGRDAFCALALVEALQHVGHELIHFAGDGPSATRTVLSRRRWPVTVRRGAATFDVALRSVGQEVGRRSRS